MTHTAYDHTWMSWLDNPGDSDSPPDPVWDMDDGDSCEWLVYVQYRGDTDYYIIAEAHKMDWLHRGESTDIIKYCLEAI